MSISVVKRQFSSTRSKLTSSGILLATTVRVSSPNATPASSTASPCLCRISAASSSSCSDMRKNLSADQGAGAANLALKLQDTVKQRLGGRRAAGNVDIHRQDRKSTRLNSS